MSGASPGSRFTSLSAGDWRRVGIRRGQYFNDRALDGFGPAAGQGGNPLHPAPAEDDVEGVILAAHQALRRRCPAAVVARRHFVVPRLAAGGPAPRAGDYPAVDAPRPLCSTSVTVAMAPRRSIRRAAAGFFFDGDDLPPLRSRLRGDPFTGLAGNLGYFMTPQLIEGTFPWSHDVRYPGHPLPVTPSYIGFHLDRGPAPGEVRCGFMGAHPGAVAVRSDGGVEILPRVPIDGYEVEIRDERIVVDAIDDAGAADRDVVLFTPALRDESSAAVVAAAEATLGLDEAWQTWAPMIPLADAAERVNMFISSVGDGEMPRERVVEIWDGAAPVPSFGGVVSLRRAAFVARFGDPPCARGELIGQPARIAPRGDGLSGHVRILGGLVPAVVDGDHALYREEASQVMAALGRYGNATSPLARSGRESNNFDPLVREPAGLLVQTCDHVGWVLFDGRHELSVGASVIDVAVLLKQMEGEGLFGQQAIEQAVFVDGGSAMKVYHVDGDGQLELMNRVAAGSRNGPGHDPDGLNLYSLLLVELA